MARATRVTRRGYIWLARNVYQPIIKVEIIKDAGGTETVTTNILDLTVTMSANVSIASFVLTLANKDGYYINMFDGGEDIQIWLGYNSTFTKVFRGQVERVYYGLDSGGHKLYLSGRDYGSVLLKRTALDSYENKEVSTILTDGTTGLITLYASDITTTNVSVTTTTIAGITFRHLSIFDCIRQLASKVSYNFYIDSDKDLNFFASNSRLCMTEAVVVGDNLKSINMGTDIKEVRNKIWVYGTNLEGGVPFLKTEQILPTWPPAWI